ncbi:MAG TPA: NAD-dependent epimerase/dehydratase family protein, partial [Candidatus Obscuribacterales bacterium]
MKALVIGGNGFIGTHLVDALLAHGHEVRVFDRYPSRFRKPIDDVEYLIGDFCNHGEMQDAVKGMEWVFHLAYTTLPQTSNDDPVYDVRSNVADTVQLLQECRQMGVAKVIFISSGGTVYGIPQTVPIPEEHPNEPICSYGISKLAIEKYLYLFYKQWGLDYVVLRISNPYGIGQNPYAKQGAIAVFMGNVARDQPITIWGDGNVVRDYLYVTDAARALVKAAEYKSSNSDPRIFNIGAGRGYSLNELIDEMRRCIKRPIEVRYTPARSLDVAVNVLDIR